MRIKTVGPFIPSAATRPAWLVPGSRGRPAIIGSMANPEQLPPPMMAAKFGIGKLTRHLFICVGPDCVDPAIGDKTWEYLKKRMKQLNLAGADGPCYRTKCQCLRICAAGPICVG